jgi:hypothetical protein
MAVYYYSQKKKDNVIIVHDHISPVKIKSVLFDNGYMVNNNDSILITTEGKNFGGYSLKIGVKINDSTTTIKGWAKSDFTTILLNVPVNQEYEPIYYGGMKGSLLKACWSEIDKIAKALSDKIEYAKQ